MKLYELGAAELSRLLKNREITSEQAVKAFLERIDDVEPSVFAFLRVDPEKTLSEARRADRMLSEGEAVSPLTGVPIAVKDNICTKGTPTTCASRMLESFVPPYDATVVARIKAAGMPVLGKTNMDEFAMGSSTENSAFGTTRNPWDLSRVPGGSSGGSAASIASNEAPLSLGSDTGGSIRQPAGFCGVAGLKPTYGRVSRFGLIAFASSLDQIGPMAGSVEDCALLLNVIAGRDPLDSTSLDSEVPDYRAYLTGDVKGLTIGLPEQYFAVGLDESVKASVLRAVRTLEEAGARVEEVSLPNTEYALATYYIIATAEASSNLARYDGVRYGHRSQVAPDIIKMYSETRREGFGSEVKRWIMLGTYGLSAGYYDAWYLKAQKVRTLIKRDFEAAFERCDVLVAPTAPTGAFKIGEKVDDPLQMYLSDIYTVTANLAGIPAMSVPCGFTREGLPVGLQVMGKPLEEGTVLRVAFAHEKLSGFEHLKPSPETLAAERGVEE